MRSMFNKNLFDHGDDRYLENDGLTRMNHDEKEKAKLMEVPIQAWILKGDAENNT